MQRAVPKSVPLVRPENVVTASEPRRVGKTYPQENPKAALPAIAAMPAPAILAQPKRAGRPAADLDSMTRDELLVWAKTRLASDRARQAKRRGKS